MTPLSPQEYEEARVIADLARSSDATLALALAAELVRLRQLREAFRAAVSRGDRLPPRLRLMAARLPATDAGPRVWTHALDEGRLAYEHAQPGALDLVTAARSVA